MLFRNIINEKRKYFCKEKNNERYSYGNYPTAGGVRLERIPVSGTFRITAVHNLVVVQKKCNTVCCVTG